jgi:hypothetical protein
MIQSRRMGWANNAARIGGRAGKVLVETSEGRDHWKDLRRIILKWI